MNSKIIDIKTGEPMPEQTPPEVITIEEAWSMLFKALGVLREASQQPRFSMLSYKDLDGRTWGLPALMRHVDRQLNFLRNRNH